MSASIPRYQYKVVASGMLDHLQRQVNTSLEEGWHTNGSLVVVAHANGGGVSFYQPMLLFIPPATDASQ